MFKKILISNRGEIVKRILTTCRSLNIPTVTIYSSNDKEAHYHALATESYEISPVHTVENYLNGDRIIEIALQAGADAIHPGYGFLSESASFAEKCAKKGITFIGPSPDLLKTLGSKTEAKKLAKSAGVPTTPGYQGDDQTLSTLMVEAEKIGFPLLIKASLGGGGKGMRIVEKASQLETALKAAKREIKAAFGDETVLLERYLLNPRHIEVQIFGDHHQNVVHLFERECSIQRRYQKIIEETPAPNVKQSVLEKLYKDALKIAQAVNYQGAGTVEFLLDEDNSHYFMEVNTRLQVEHTITEETTGLDLVEWQIRVAAGEPLPLQQNQIKRQGNALEARLCAENPFRDFLPVSGRLSTFALPLTQNMRLDSGVVQGDTISPYYDSLLAKVIGTGETRTEAIDCLNTALGSLALQGLQTNREYLRAILNSPPFRQEKITTHFIADHHQELVEQARHLPFPVLCLAAISKLLEPSTTPNPSPWESLVSWRMNYIEKIHLPLHYLNQPFEVTVFPRSPHDFQVFYQDKFSDCTVTATQQIQVEGQTFPIPKTLSNGALEVEFEGTVYIIECDVLMSLAHEHGEMAGHLEAPMPGKIAAVLIREGDTVNPGTPLLILEAMKMEHSIKAPFKGRVKKLPYSPGSLVEEGAELIVIEPLEEAS